MKRPFFATAALGLLAASCAAPAVAPAANPFPVPTSATQAGSRIYDSLRACGQPGVDLRIGRTDEITVDPFNGAFAGMRVSVEPAPSGAMVTVSNLPITPVLLARVRGWAINGPDC